jgi:hypothetical protein
VGAEGAGRGDVRASCKFSMVSAEGEMGGESDDDTDERGVAEGVVWPNQRKTGYGGLWGDLRELGGSVGMLSGDKRRLTGRGARLDLRRIEATLLEECMFGPEMVLRTRHGAHSCRRQEAARQTGLTKNDDHGTSQTTFGAPFAACNAGRYVYFLIFW